MPPAAWTGAEHSEQKKKLAQSYSDLLNDFASKDLQTVGNYTVGKLIGKGSFGKVYLATHNLTNGSKVVLKSTKKEDANLAREIHHHRQFVHPHIARLYEVIVTESLVWLVLEYCPGNELYDHLIHNGPMEEANVQRVFSQLAGAVSYVHSKGCVHRDLKLENCLLDKNGNVKLCDFGFTREYQGSMSYLTTWCGTICYSAPEMLKGEKYAGEKVDVWSLGIVAYALLRGELPFDDDDETVTKSKILTQEPAYPETMPAQAVDLIKSLLSKRPLLRPSLADILRHPWLAEHAPLQQEILKLKQPDPFSTQLEQDTLHRMRSAGINTEVVMEHVLAQRCDALAGWWALLIDKEERKERRRQRRRKEKEAEAKNLRRLSAASGKLLRTSSLKGINEEEQAAVIIGDPPKSRGRHSSRSNASSLQPELPMVAERKTLTPDPSHITPPKPKDPARSTSSTRRRPIPPPKELPRRPRTASRGSSTMLRVVHNNPDLLAPPPTQMRKRLYQRPFRDQLASLKSWFKESTKRGKTPLPPKKTSAPRPPSQITVTSPDLRRTSTGQLMDLRKASGPARPDIQTRATYPTRPRLATRSSTGSVTSVNARGHSKRPSLSPSPITPRGSYRRNSFGAGLRGRKSTSSSISSVRSMHAHVPSHSKASSVSSASASVASPKLSIVSKTPRSPHTSIKVLPTTPTLMPGSLSAGGRVHRRPVPSAISVDPAPDDGQKAAHRLSGPLPAHLSGGVPGFGPPPTSPGLHAIFAKRKRNLFKGPSAAGLHHAAAGSSSPRGRSSTGGSADSRGGSVPGRRSIDMMAVTEEDEEAELAAEYAMDSEGISPMEEYEDVDDGDVFMPLEEHENDVELGGAQQLSGADDPRHRVLGRAENALMIGESPMERVQDCYIGPFGEHEEKDAVRAASANDSATFEGVSLLSRDKDEDHPQETNGHGHGHQHGASKATEQIAV